MTTTIKVTSHNYPAIVEILDSGNLAYSVIQTPDDGEQTYYCTTTRVVRVTDLEYDDPRVVAAKHSGVPECR